MSRATDALADIFTPVILLSLNFRKTLIKESRCSSRVSGGTNHASRAAKFPQDQQLSEKLRDIFGSASNIWRASFLSE